MSNKEENDKKYTPMEIGSFDGERGAFQIPGGEAINHKVLAKYKSTFKEMTLGLVVQTIDFLAQRAHQTAAEHGFWPEGRPDTEFIALAHSELSEALEALRSGNPESVKIPGHSHLAEELADTVIRILDFAYAKGIDLGPAILAKMEYNEGRSHKHGREF